MPRRFTPYEQNLLRRFGYNPEEVSRTIDQNMPIEYFLGHAEFIGNFFKINNSTLIPRVETEELVQMAIKHIDELIVTKETIEILEIGTGSGAIILSLLQYCMRKRLNANFTATDISHKALEVSRENYNQVLKNTINNFKDKTLQVEFIQSDLFDQIPKKRFDIIVSNPPYVPSRRIEKLEASVAKFEPKLALDGGSDGFSLVHKILITSTNYLTPKGRVFLEVEDTHDETFVQKNYLELLRLWELQFIKDYNEKNRFIVAKR